MTNFCYITLAHDSLTGDTGDEAPASDLGYEIWFSIKNQLRGTRYAIYVCITGTRENNAQSCCTDMAPESRSRSRADIWRSRTSQSSARLVIVKPAARLARDRKLTSIEFLARLVREVLLARLANSRACS